VDSGWSEPDRPIQDETLLQPTSRHCHAHSLGPASQRVSRVGHQQSSRKRQVEGDDTSLSVALAIAARPIRSALPTRSVAASSHWLPARRQCSCRHVPHKCTLHCISQISVLVRDGPKRVDGPFRCSDGWSRPGVALECLSTCGLSMRSKNCRHRREGLDVTPLALREQRDPNASALARAAETVITTAPAADRD